MFHVDDWRSSASPWWTDKRNIVLENDIWYMIPYIIMQPMINNVLQCASTIAQLFFWFERIKWSIACLDHYCGCAPYGFFPPKLLPREIMLSMFLSNMQPMNWIARSTVQRRILFFFFSLLVASLKLTLRICWCPRRHSWKTSLSMKRNKTPLGCTHKPDVAYRGDSYFPSSEV